MVDILGDAETIRIRIETELAKSAQSLQGDIDKMAASLRNMAKDSGASLNSVAQAMRESGLFLKEEVTQALALAKALEKIATAQKSIVPDKSVLGAADQARVQREQAALQAGKELELAERMLAAEDMRLAKLAQRNAVEKARYDQKLAELEVDRAGEAFEAKRRAEEAQALLTQERKLGLENSETQEYREQLTALQQLAALDAQRLQGQLNAARTEALPVTGDKAALALRKIRDAESGLLDVSTPLTEKQRQLVQELKNVGKEAKGGLFSLNNFLRTAFGTLTAIGIFTVLTTIQEFFTTALGAADKFRKNLASLNFAEAILSQNGMEITRQELDETVKFIEEKYKYLGTLEVTGIVATVADMGAEFKLTKDQVVGLSDAVAFLQLKERAYGMEVSDVGSIVNAALDGRSNFFNKLGINITKTAIAEKAYAMGLAESGAQITKEQSNQAAIALLIEQTAGKYDELLVSIEKVNPALANELRISKTLQDTSLEVGEAVLDVKDAWNELLATLIEGGTFEELKNGLIILIQTVGDVLRLFTDLYATTKDLEGAYKEFGGEAANVGNVISSWLGPFQILLTFLQLIYLGFTTIVGAIITAMGGLSEFFAYASGAKSYEEAGRALGEHFSNGILEGIAAGLKPLVAGKNDPLANYLRDIMNMLGKDISTPELPDTPTGEAPGEIEDNQEDLQKALEKMNDEILEAQLKLAQDMEEAAIDLGRKLEDITIEYARKRADAEIDYMSTVADINADYQNTIAQINQEQAQANAEANADALQREAEFQEQMRQLKERFLMDLEDALHARDARQILRLIKQYNLEKEQAEREYALEQENAQREQEIRNQRFQAERADAERQRQAKLAEARREYQDKLAKLAADEAAERAAAELAYQRKMEDLEREMQNRLEIVAANLVAEFNLTKEGLDAILALYKKYYAEVAQIYAAMNAMLAGQANVGSTSKPAGGPTGGGTGGGGGSTSGSGGAKPFAEGGTVIANRPTRALFGEKGLEMATFTPLGRTGQDINKVFSNLSGEAGGEGRLTLEMLLSPDLEARIVQNTLGQTANIIAKVRRSK